ncbi:MAG: S-methyl-5'-thioinosine phosphorylase [Cellvibrionaceae bacterium]
MLAIIGGSGLDDFEGLTILGRKNVSTPYGEPASDLIFGELNHSPVIFLPRHGSNHQLAPHEINYRANLWALQKEGVTKIIAVNAVGGIHPDMGPEVLVVPHQVIDYTYGREHTYSCAEGFPLLHVDFTHPYTDSLRMNLLKAAEALNFACVNHGVYGATQGPRLETAAEILRLKNDGCDIVGMTGMPEASLARELGIPYAQICLVVNWCAGLSDELITMEAIVEVLKGGMGRVRQIIAAVER